MIVSAEERASRDKRNAYAREWRKNNKESADFATRKWRQKNKAAVVAMDARKAARRADNGKKKDYDLRKLYGITLLDYTLLYEAQNGRCAICEYQHARLHVDHDHATGKVRALLCTRCNPGIGYFKDSIHLLESAIAYLKKYA